MKEITDKSIANQANINLAKFRKINTEPIEEVIVIDRPEDPNKLIIVDSTKYIKQEKEKKIKKERREYRRKVNQLTNKNTEGIKNIEKRKWREYDLDHIVPAIFGFEYNIDPKIISQKENLQVITHKENVVKGNLITTEAINIMRKWLKKYPNLQKNDDFVNYLKSVS